MATEITNSGAPPKKTVWTALLAKAVVLVLLFSVAGLATLAKNGQYYPKSNPANQVSISTKMNLAHAPAHLAKDHLQPAALSARLRPALQICRMASISAPRMLRAGLTVLMQDRSPPVARA